MVSDDRWVRACRVESRREVGCSAAILTARYCASNCAVAAVPVARLNFSHGDHDYHRAAIQNLRDVMQDTRRICALLLDTKGCDAHTRTSHAHTHGPMRALRS